MRVVLLVVKEARAQKNSARVRIYARAVLVCRGERLLIRSNKLLTGCMSLNPLPKKCHIEIRTRILELENDIISLPDLFPQETLSLGKTEIEKFTGTCNELTCVVICL